MRFLWVYLALYFALVGGALIALWQGGVLAHLSSLSILIPLAAAICLGVLLAIVWLWRPSKAKPE